MDILSQAFAWLTNPLHWQGPNGIPVRLAQHVAISVVSLAIALLIGFAVRLAVLGGPNWASPAEPSKLARLSYGLGLYVAILCAINFISVLVQCGFGQCHTTGYALLR